MRTEKNTPARRRNATQTRVGGRHIAAARITFGAAMVFAAGVSIPVFGLISFAQWLLMG